MKKGILIGLLVVLVFFDLSAQNTSNTNEETKIFVPYKLGEKFGISDQYGNIVLTPKYDFIDLYYTPNFFTAFNYGTNNSYKTSLILKDNVLIKDQNYFGYYYDNDVISAVLRREGKGTGYYSFHPEGIDLYSMDGKRITKETYRFAGVIDDFDQDNILQYQLLQLIHLDGTYSFVVYDKKTTKIIKKIVDKAKDILFMSEVIPYKYKEFAVRYINSKDEEQEVKIRLKEGIFVGEDRRTLKKKPKSKYDVYLDDEVEVPFDSGNRIRRRPKEDKHLTLREVKIKNDYVGYRPPSLYFDTWNNYAPHVKVIVEDGKKGVYNEKSEKYIHPVIYNDIFKAEFKGFHVGGSIFLKDGKYSIKMSTFRGEKYKIDGVFDNFPFVLYPSYVTSDFHLVSLFDADGKFLYYANQDGLIYYKKE